MTTSRIAALLAALALLATACTGAPTAAPTGAASPPPAATPEPGTPEPGTPEPGTPEPGTPEPGTPEPATPEPGTPEPGTEPPVGGEADLRWFCCLGTGETPEQVAVEEQVAADFSAASANANLTFEVVTFAQARDALSTQIAGGNPPDIVGPAGVGGLEAFHGQWLDLQPLIDSSGFDVTQYDPAAVEFYSTEEGQIGLPFATYPSMLWYVPGLFDEAGLEYPPHAYGDPYILDGAEVPWDYNTVREIAMRLTVDAAGNDATSADFDPDAIVQYGFEPQRDDLRTLGAYFGAGSLVAEDGTTAQAPDAWKDAWRFFYDGMWTDHFILTGPIFEAPEWSSSGYAFHSGNVAMSNNFLWSQYGVTAGNPLEGGFDVAAVPAHNGVHTAPLNADTFVIHEGTQNPEEAFEALAYLQVDAGQTLLDPAVYGGLPALLADQDAFLDNQNASFPHGADWQVAQDSLAHADNPNFEAFMPKYNETLNVLATYNTRWTTTPDLDLDAEIAAMEAEIQTIWDAP